MKIIIHSSVDGKFYFTINSRNGQVICTSENYEKRPNALLGKLSAALIAKIIDNTKK